MTKGIRLPRSNQPRLKRWNEPHYGIMWRSPAADKVLASLWEQYDARLKEKGTEPPGLSLPSICTSAKELIFDMVDRKPVFHVILFSLDSDRLALKPDHCLDLVDMTPDQVKGILAMAGAFGVPVYPNTPELAEPLARVQKDLLEFGFSTEDPSGRKAQLRLVNNPLARGFQDLELREMPSPAELHLLREAVRMELSQRDEAGRLLTTLRIAVEDLENSLKEKKRNENDIQRSLTTNPILFGVECCRIIPKHRLGSDYVMDYALERMSGTYDLVEIEASTHRLFTQNGNPTSALVHAEQQVLDWLAWIERNPAYAREQIPNIQQPLGYVIIGRRVFLSRADEERLTRRNIAFRATMQILTYDDLLDRARKLLGLLQGRKLV